MITTYTKTQLQYAVSKDSLRPALQGVFYEPSKGTITATNGHIMFQAKVEVEEEDTQAILPLSSFENRGFWTRGNRLRIQTKELEGPLGWLDKGQRVAITTAMESTKTMGAKIEPVTIEVAEFPDYEPVLSSALKNAGSRPVVKTSFFLDYLITLDKVVPNSFQDSNLELRFNGDAGAAVINSEAYNWVFIIMPRRIDPDSDSIFEAFKRELLVNVTSK